MVIVLRSIPCLSSLNKSAKSSLGSQIGTESKAKTNLIPYHQATLRANNLVDFGADFPLTPEF
jgi:hypothetical protein